HLNYLVKQLNLLIGFLEVSEENIYDLIKTHDSFGFGFSIESSYENEYENYKNHVTTSAFILGFAHFEDFISKSLIELLIFNPTLNKYKIPFKTFEEKGNEIINFIAIEQTKRLTFTDKIKFIEENISDLDQEIIADLRLANIIRNCLLHNNGIAAEKIGDKFQKGERIKLSSAEVNAYGLKARYFASDLWEKLNSLIKIH
nr:hypothetical protein [Ignavibacteria bacterium]